MTAREPVIEANPPDKRGAGRPPKPLDGKQVERLAAIGCTIPEIATALDCGRRTIQIRFKKELRRGWRRGKRSLRRMQWKAAKTGNPTMLIWLGKQMLGQKDKVEHGGANGGPLKVVVEYVDACQKSDSDFPAATRARYE